MQIYLEIRDSMAHSNLVSLGCVSLPPAKWNNNKRKQAHQTFFVSVKQHVIICYNHVVSLLPREICRILIIYENFVVKWSRESFVRQSYQILFGAWKTYTLVELICRNDIGAQIVHRRTLGDPQKSVKWLGKVNIRRHDDVDIGEKCVESLAIFACHIAKKVLGIGELQE